MLKHENVAADLISDKAKMKAVKCSITTPYSYIFQYLRECFLGLK